MGSVSAPMDSQSFLAVAGTPQLQGDQWMISLVRRRFSLMPLDGLRMSQPGWCTMRTKQLIPTLLTLLQTALPRPILASSSGSTDNRSRRLSVHDMFQHSMVHGGRSSYGMEGRVSVEICRTATQTGTVLTTYFGCLGGQYKVICIYASALFIHCKATYIASHYSIL